MLTRSPENVPGNTPEDNEPARNLRRERRLWHDGQNNMPSLGCSGCPEKNVCGGLQVNRAFFDCLESCCRKPETCDKVCRNNPKVFVRSRREIEGFEFDTVPRAPILPKPPLPPIAPILYHGSSRVVPFRVDAVCLPLYGAIARHDGVQRFASGSALAAKFGIADDVSVILTGTDTDAPLERWWSLSGRRLDAIRAIRDLGIKLVTTPNYSLFTDRPRWDDLHSMKRIAIVHEEFLREGMPAALHLNARTDRDWERWTRYVSDRPEVTHVAFEFGTGAGWATRSPWHADQLVRFSRAVGRPLHLLIRGGAKVLPTLIGEFDATTFLETTVFTKTRSRQRAVPDSNGTVKWQPFPTAEGAPIDSLLTQNWNVVTECFSNAYERKNPPLIRAVG